jgi:hypothetical protein
MGYKAAGLRKGRQIREKGRTVAQFAPFLFSISSFPFLLHQILQELPLGDRLQSL